MRPRDKAANRKSMRPRGVDLDRAERLAALLVDLAELNRRVPVIVEGRRDEEALRELGLAGEVITFNRGKGVAEFCADIAHAHGEAVLLMDWDPEGESLQGMLGRELAGVHEAHARYRFLLRAMCQKEVKDVQGVPGLLRRLKGDAV